jgi:hypothetical protein
MTIDPSKRLLINKDLKKDLSYGQQIIFSWNNIINQCIVNNSLSLLPTQNAIYLIDKDYNRQNEEFKVYLKLLNNNNKYLISTEVGRFMEKYKQYFISEDIYSNFEISKMELHPNAIANQMYADILFDEITTNPSWNFKK